MRRVPNSPLDIFGGFNDGGGFGLHGEESADEQNRGADHLRDGEALVKDYCRQTKRREWTKKLQALGESDADLVNRDVIQNVGEGNTGHGGDDQDPIYVCTDVNRRGEISESEH